MDCISWNALPSNSLLDFATGKHEQVISEEQERLEIYFPNSITARLQLAVSVPFCRSSQLLLGSPLLFHSLQVLATPSDQVEPNGGSVFFRLELASGCIFIFSWFPSTHIVWTAFIRLSHPLCWTILWTIFPERYRPLLIFCFYGREHKRTEISWVEMIDC